MSDYVIGSDPNKWYIFSLGRWWYISSPPWPFGENTTPRRLVTVYDTGAQALAEFNKGDIVQFAQSYANLRHMQLNAGMN